MATISDRERVDNEEILITVSWGKEVLQPMKYHSIEIGPYQMSKKVRRGDAAEHAAEMSAELEAIAEVEFKRKAKAFLDRVTRLNRLVHDNRER